MINTVVRWEICLRDEDGFNPLVSCSTRTEAEAALRKYKPRPYYQGAFVVRTIMTRVGPRQPQRLRAV